jgi:hypothetical protein
MNNVFIKIVSPLVSEEIGQGCRVTKERNGEASRSFSNDLIPAQALDSLFCIKNLWVVAESFSFALETSTERVANLLY